MATIIGDVPTAEVIAAFEADVVSVKRWVDIYEADNTTLWRSQVAIEEGTVSVDMSRGERRNFQCTLNDADDTLGYGETGFWYDKIIKPYKGVKLPDYWEPSHIRVPGVIGNYVSMTRAAPTTPTSVEMAVRATFDQVSVDRYLAGWGNADVSLAVNSDNKIFFLATNTVGGSVGNVGSAVDIPLVVGQKVWVRAKVTASNGTCEFWYSFSNTSNYEAVVWVPLGTPVVGSGAGTTIRTTNATTVTFGTHDSTVAGFQGKLHAGAEVLSAGKTIEFDPGGVTVSSEEGDGSGLETSETLLTSPTLLTEGTTAGPSTFPAVTGQTMTIVTSGPISAQIVNGFLMEGDTWVTCLGEFMVDTISRPHFPSSMSVGCRDFVKKLTLDKFSVTTGFAVGTNVAAAIQAIAINGGITKFNFASPGDTVLAQMNFDRGSPRWDAMMKLAESISHEVYFDNFGVLTLRPYVDPLTAPVAYTFTTGVTGNLVSFNRSTNDTQMFNDIIVYGDGPDNPLVFAQAENNNPSSPTRIDKVGRRTWPYASQFISTNAQALVRAESFLRVLGLEQYDVSLESLTLPWLEAGDAVEAILPDSVAGEPTRFLLTSFQVSMALGPMTATAKRVSIVG